MQNKQFVSSSPLVARYTALARKYRVLTREETKDLIIRYHDNNDQEAYQLLIKHNLRLVIKVSNEFYRKYPTLSQMDLIGAGSLGLCSCIRSKKFDLSRELSLLTYAIWWIKAELWLYVASNMFIKPPDRSSTRKLIYRRKEIEKIIEEKDEDKKQELLVSLSKETDIPEEIVIDFINYKRTVVLSIDTPIVSNKDNSLDEMTFHDVIEGGNLGEDIDSIDRQDKLKDIIKEIYPHISPREQVILERRFLNPKRETLAEIAKDYNISRERIRQLEEKALQTLREALVDRDIINIQQIEG